MSDVLVIGSLNMDLVVQTVSAPRAGETVPGFNFQMVPGGKGANQAVAAARLGGAVSMVGCVGDDPFGHTLRRELQEQGLNVEHVHMAAGYSTGTALIMVDDEGENRIIVVAGANGRLNSSHVYDAEPLFAAARVVVLQFEILLETVEVAMRLARTRNVPIILNPAPAYEVPLDFFFGAHVLVLNETECETITGIEIGEDGEGAEEAADLLRGHGVENVVLTLGAKGALVAGAQGLEHVPGFSVRAVDTTAAGDAFIGSLAASVAQGVRLMDAVRLANAAGALTVTRRGAQPSLPTAREVEAFLQEKDHSGSNQTRGS